MAGGRGTPKRALPQLGERVFARVRGFPAWPARVEAIEGRNRYRVLFYGTYQKGFLKAEEIFPYNEETKKKFGKSKGLDFAKSMDEIEHNPNIEVLDEPLMLEPDEEGESGEKYAPDTAAMPSSSSHATLSKADATPTTSRVHDNDAGKMWVKVKATREVIELDFDEHRPVNSKKKDKKKELKWEKAAAKNALKTDTGRSIPEEVRKKFAAQINRTEEQKRKEMKNEKIRWLKTELRLVDLNSAIKKTLHYKKPSADECLETLQELTTLPIEPLMLKKRPEIVATIRQLRKYVGPEEHDGEEMDDVITEKAERIRLLADKIFHQIMSLFSTVEMEPADFCVYFDLKVIEFHKMVAGKDEKEVLQMVKEPKADY